MWLQLQVLPNSLEGAAGANKYCCYDYSGKATASKWLAVAIGPVMVVASPKTARYPLFQAAAGSAALYRWHSWAAPYCNSCFCFFEAWLRGFHGLVGPFLHVYTPSLARTFMTDTMGSVSSWRMPTTDITYAA